MKVSKPQNMTPKATASMAAVIRSTPRQPMSGRVASVVLRAVREVRAVCVDTLVGRWVVILLSFSRGIRVAGCLGEAGTRHTDLPVPEHKRGMASARLRFSTSFAGASRSRFEGLRRTALSALWGAPLLLQG